MRPQKSSEVKIS